MSDGQDTAEAGGRRFDPREAVRVVVRFGWIAVVLAVLGGVGGAVWTSRQPRIYSATATLEYEPNPPRPLGRGVEDVADPFGNFWASREFFDTQNRVIASRNVLDRVVQQLALHQDAGFHGHTGEAAENFEGSSIESTAALLASRLAVEPVPSTRLVNVVVKDGDPERAASIANAIAAAYIEKTLEDRMRSTVTALEWLDGQLTALRSDLEASENALYEFKREHDVLSLSLEENQNVIAHEILAFSEALTTARTRRIELAARAERLRRALSMDPLEAPLSGLTNVEAIAALRSALVAKLAERERLSVRYGDNHPDMVALNAEIRMQQEQLVREMRSVINGTEGEFEEARRVEGGLRAAVNEAHSDGLDLNLREIEYQRLNRERENKAEIYQLVLQRTTETDLTRMLQVTHAHVLDRALPPTAPISPVLMTNLGGGSAAGLVLGLAVIALLLRLDRRLKSVEDVEALGLKVVGILPRLPEMDLPELSSHHRPTSAAAECARTIRTNLTFMNAARPSRCFVITSASPREGKTTIACNIAIALAHSSKSVLLIDTDLRRPRAHKPFGIANKVGVTSVILGETTLAEAVAHTEVDGLHLLPSGPVPPNPSELLHTPAFQALRDAAMAAYEWVIFDSPPVGAVTDSAVIAPQVDGVMLVVRAQQTTRESVEAALRQMRAVDAVMIGCVVNDVDVNSRTYGYGYHQYYRSESYAYTADPADAAG
ncbi:MAG: polysaccharide biosynthesis tyrosine autokinase [Myxococcales bacterium]|nr:polysaccharide biosynthesis tyrosine autokinase [Myxococcales bacterium]MCB9626771.1 polysaccharide biosynthesis tyrosine autokinase [Sandaracinaceae bacterium]